MSKLSLKAGLRVCALVLLIGSCALLLAQSPATKQSPVPHLMKFSGVVMDAAGQPRVGVAGITFALYKEQQGGSPLWSETQNVTLNASGHYTVQLGAARSAGLPDSLFTSGDAKWLSITPEGQAEQPRVLLMSVPYALKAADAETLGGKPASSFVLSAPTTSQVTGNAHASTSPKILPPLGGSGTVNYIPRWTPDGNTLGTSVMYQSTANNSIGVGTTAPSAKLHAYVSASSAVAVEGDTSGSYTVGVLGKSTGLSWDSTGVYGIDSNTGGNLTMGMWGTSYNNSGGIGMLGSGRYTSTIANYMLGSSHVGVWGDGDSYAITGVMATSDAGRALEAVNNSSSATTITAVNDASTSRALDVSAGGGYCWIDQAGLFCNGSKSAVVPVSDGRQVALYAVESPENWFEDFGSAKLVNGAVTVQLDPTFAQTVNLHSEYHVFLTPNGDCKGLYVRQKGPASFEVRENGGGSSNLAFDYRIVAKRSGYEGKRLEDMQATVKELKTLRLHEVSTHR